ncbi:hypothetical protein BF49_2812 [Bradyrhizobium sp.]|nr:hypothetical protein BF49_2812 [Bradyrhizobium sp.]
MKQGAAGKVDGHQSGLAKRLEAVRHKVEPIATRSRERLQSHVRRPWSYGPASLPISWPCGQLRDRPRHPRLRTAYRSLP